MNNPSSPIPVDPSEQFDTRVVEHRVRRYQHDKAAYEAWLASLPDDAEHASESNVRFTSPYAEKYKRARRA
jgi:hypothetical protein